MQQGTSGSFRAEKRMVQHGEGAGQQVPARAGYGTCRPGLASAAAGTTPGQRGPWCGFRAGHCAKQGVASASSSSSAGGVRPKLNCGAQRTGAVSACGSQRAHAGCLIKRFFSHARCWWGVAQTYSPLFYLPARGLWTSSVVASQALLACRIHETSLQWQHQPPAACHMKPLLTPSSPWHAPGS